MGPLPLADRCWVVAGLTLSGLTAEEIADRMACSLRLVRSIRAEDMTQLCVYVMTETSNFTDENRLLRGELTAVRRELDESNAEGQRTRAQLSRLIDAQITGVKMCGKCGEPMDRYNAYIHEASGKEFCRNCHRVRQQKYRDKKKLENRDSKVVTPMWWVGSSPAPAKSGATIRIRRGMCVVGVSPGLRDVGA